MREFMSFAFATLVVFALSDCQKKQSIGDKAVAIYDEYTQKVETLNTLDLEENSEWETEIETKISEIEEELNNLEETDPEEYKKEKAKVDVAYAKFLAAIEKKVEELVEDGYDNLLKDDSKTTIKDEDELIE